MNKLEVGELVLIKSNCYGSSIYGKYGRVIKCEIEESLYYKIEINGCDGYIFYPYELEKIPDKLVCFI